MAFASALASSSRLISEIKDISDFARGKSAQIKSGIFGEIQGRSVFPGNGCEFIKELDISAEEICEFIDQNSKFSDPNFIAPIIIGCVTYVSTIDMSEHQTGFSLMLVGASKYKGDALFPVIRVVPEYIHKSHIRLVPNTIGGHDY